MMPLLLPLAAAFASMASAASESCEESALLQKNLAALKDLKTEKQMQEVNKTEKIPSFFAIMGLNMATGLLQTACNNVEQEVKMATAFLHAESGSPLESFESESTEKLSGVFETMQLELEKGVKQVEMGLMMLGLSSSMTALQSSLEIAKEEIKKMKESCNLVEPDAVQGCAAAAAKAHERLTETFEAWIKAAAAELVTKVNSAEQEKMEAYNKEKVPATTSMVDEMGAKVASLISTIAQQIEDDTSN